MGSFIRFNAAAFTAGLEFAFNSGFASAFDSDFAGVFDSGVTSAFDSVFGFGFSFAGLTAGFAGLLSLMVLMGFLSFLLVLGPHSLEPLFHVGLQLIFRDGVVMIRVGLGKTAPDEVRHFILGQLSVLVRVGLREQEVDWRLSVHDVPHPKRTGTDAVRAHRTAVLASLVESAVEGEPAAMPKAAAMLSAKTAPGETVSAETVVMGEAVSAMVPESVPAVVCESVSESVSAVMGPTERTAMASAMVSPAVPAVMPVSTPVATPPSVMTRPTEFAVMSMTTVTRPTTAAILAPAMVMTVMMVVVVTRPGVTAAMTVPVSSVVPALAMMSLMAAPMSLVLALRLSVPSPFVPAVAVAPIAFFVAHSALFVMAAPATLGMLSPSVLAAFVVAALGNFVPSAVAAPATVRPRSVIGLLAIRVAVASAWSVVPPIAFVPAATDVISVVATVVRQFVRSGFVALRRSPVHMGRELHQSGSRNPTQKHQHIVSHSIIPSPDLTTFFQLRLGVTLAVLP